MSDHRKGFRQAADRVFWKIYELEATVSDFKGDQELLNKRINGLVSELGGLAEQRESLAAEVPVELLRYLDEGGNPDIFTAEVFRRANRGNQLAKGRVQAFAQLRDELLAQAEQAFPEEAFAFKALSQPLPAQQEPSQAQQGAGHSSTGGGPAMAASSSS